MLWIFYGVKWLCHNSTSGFNGMSSLLITKAFCWFHLASGLCMIHFLNIWLHRSDSIAVDQLYQCFSHLKQSNIFSYQNQTHFHYTNLYWRNRFMILIRCEIVFCPFLDISPTDSDKVTVFAVCVGPGSNSIARVRLCGFNTKKYNWNQLILAILPSTTFKPIPF